MLEPGGPWKAQILVYSERIKCDKLAVGPCQQLHGRRQRDLDLVHLLRSLWLTRPFPLRLRDRGQRHTAGSKHWKPAQAGKRGLQWGVAARLIQAEESHPLTEAIITLARNTGGQSAGEPCPRHQGEQCEPGFPALCLGTSLRTGYVSSLWGTLRIGPL